MISFTDQYKKPEWQKTRLRILDRDEYTCVICGDDESQLQVHHLRYENGSIFVEDKYLTTLCSSCHEDQTDLYKLVTMRLREILMNDPMKDSLLSFINMRDSMLMYNLFKVLDDDKLCVVLESNINALSVLRSSDAF